MNTKQLIRHARILFDCGVKNIDRHNRKAWVRSVLRLGNNWVALKHVDRITNLQVPTHASNRN